MPTSGITYTDIVSLYKTQFAKLYPFHHPANPDYKEGEWIKIAKRHDKMTANIFPFILAINEIFRFEIGNMQPECRLSDQYILSRRIKQEDVDEYEIRTLYFYWRKLTSGEHFFWEGMGKVIFCKYLYQDNDFHIYNGLVDINNHFIGLDADKCFWSITEKYHYGANYKPDNVKVLLHNNSPYNGRAITTPSGERLFVIFDKKRDFMGDIHKDDYDTLPRMKHFHPTHWFLLAPELESYTQALSNHPRFLDEKHFATLKALVTTNIKQLLIDLHIEDAKDKQDAQQFIATQLAKLTEACKQSDAFLQYLREHSLTAIQVILREINSFFNFNAAYKLKENEAPLAVVKYFHDDVIAQFKCVLGKFELGVQVA